MTGFGVTNWEDKACTRCFDGRRCNHYNLGLAGHLPKEDGYHVISNPVNPNLVDPNPPVPVPDPDDKPEQIDMGNRFFLTNKEKGSFDVEGK